MPGHGHARSTAGTSINAWDPDDWPTAGTRLRTALPEVDSLERNASASRLEVARQLEAQP